MKNNLIKIYCIVTVFLGMILLVMGCSPSGNAELNTEVCNLPPVEFAYPPFATPESFPTPIPIRNAWEPQLSSEQTQDVNLTLPISGIVDQIAARTNDEIWLKINQRILRYTPSTHDIVEFTIRDEEDTLIVPNEIIIDSDNSLWVASPNGIDNRLVLSQYNPETDNFDIQFDESDILFQSEYVNELDHMWRILPVP
ncbi:MAG: hypothetical protein FVQ83_14630 [Chloroflexi bacterium]|nr:hypothetical protein [Chloroflexota bacterium]